MGKKRRGNRSKHRLSLKYHSLFNKLRPELKADVVPHDVSVISRHGGLRACSALYLGMSFSRCARSFQCVHMVACFFGTVDETGVRACKVVLPAAEFITHTT